MLASGRLGIAFWSFLVAYGVVLYALAPSARGVEGFFRGRDRRERETSGLDAQNAYGLAICTAGFLLPLAWGACKARRA